MTMIKKIGAAIFMTALFCVPTLANETEKTEIKTPRFFEVGDLCNQLGISFDYATMTGVKDDITFKIESGNQNMNINGENQSIIYAPVTQNDKVYVYPRHIANAVGYSTSYKYDSDLGHAITYIRNDGELIASFSEVDIVKETNTNSEASTKTETSTEYEVSTGENRLKGIVSLISSDPNPKIEITPNSVFVSFTSPIVTAPANDIHDVLKCVKEEFGNKKVEIVINTTNYKIDQTRNVKTVVTATYSANALSKMNFGNEPLWLNIEDYASDFWVHPNQKLR